MTTNRALSSGEYFKFELGNGLRVVGERHAHARSVSIGLWVRLGSAYESPSDNGASHFLEHMVFRGTRRRSAEEIATVLEARGGDLNAFTERELTCFHATVLREDLPLAISVLGDLVTGPVFDKKQFEKERRVLLQELAMIEDVPEEWMFDLFAATIWPKEPLGQPVMGTRKTISKFKVSSLIRFFEDHYRPDNMVLSVAGEFDVNELRVTVEKELAWPRKSQCVLPSRRLQSKYRARKKSVCADIEQRHLLIGYDGVSFTDPDRYSALILSVYLGGGTGSRLFQEVRERSAMAYTVEAELMPFCDSGLFTIYVGLDPRALGACLEIVRREIQAVVTRPIAPRDMQRVKSQVRGMIYLSSEYMDSRQEALGRNELVFGRYVGVDDLVDRVDKVDSDSVQAAANRLFQSKKESVLTMGRKRIEAKRLGVL